MQTHARTVEQTREVLNVTVQLQYALNKLMNANLVGLLQAVRHLELNFLRQTPFLLSLPIVIGINAPKKITKAFAVITSST